VLDTVLAAATLYARRRSLAGLAGKSGARGRAHEPFGYRSPELQSVARAHPDHVVTAVPGIAAARAIAGGWCPEPTAHGDSGDMHPARREARARAWW